MNHSIRMSHRQADPPRDQSVGQTELISLNREADRAAAVQACLVMSSCFLHCRVSGLKLLKPRLTQI